MVEVSEVRGRRRSRDQNLKALALEREGRGGVGGGELGRRATGSRESECRGRRLQGLHRAMAGDGLRRQTPWAPGSEQPDYFIWPLLVHHSLS